MGQSVCCCRRTFWDHAEEKDVILRCKVGSGHDPDGGIWVDRGWTAQRRTSGAAPIVEPNSDDDLHTLIVMRSRVDEDTEEWEKLNYDIHTLRCVRRQVCARWKKILLQMGYQREVEFLLEVNRQGEREDLNKARELLHTLWKESSLFPTGFSTPEKYLFVMDHLVSLDSAEEFVQLAREKYPKT